MRRAWLAMFVLGSASAGPYQELLSAIDAARTRVYVFSPSVFDARLGDALRRARLDPLRRVKVRVVTVPYYNYASSSVALSLALAGVPLAEAQVPYEGGLVIVDAQGWRGASLGRTPGGRLTRLPTSSINTAARWFETVLRAASPLTQLEAFERLRKVTP